MNKLKLLIAGLLLVICVSPVMAISAQYDTRDAEVIAQTYMTAFYHGDANIAARQLHPKSLENIRTAILEELKKAKKAGKTQELLNQFGFDVTAESLQKMTSYEIYAEIIKSNHLKAGKDASQAMRAATVKAIETHLIKPDKAIVSLRIKIPKNGQFITQNTTLSLLRHSGSWKVVPDGQ